MVVAGRCGLLREFYNLVEYGCPKIPPGPMYYAYFYITWRRCGWRNWGICADVHSGMGSNWSPGDWVAWGGGKGWYSSYDPGNCSPDILKKFGGHHEEFSPMIDNLEATDGGAYNYNLNNRFQPI